MLVAMLIFVAAAKSETCPVVQCGTTSLGVCCVRNASDIIVNYQGCTATTFCELNGILDWFNRGGKSVNCTVFTEETTNNTDVDCGVQNEQEMLLKDIHPVRCMNDSDCVLKSSNKSTCSCGLDGHKYCQPEWGSEVFDLFWSYCKKNNNTVPYEMWQYFNSLREYYPLYITAPDCAMNIFYELQILKELPGVGRYLGFLSILLILLIG